MIKKIIVLVFLVINLAFDSSLFAAHFEGLIELAIKVEDANYSLHVKSLRFNEIEIELDKPDLFKPRKLLQYKLPPGRYMLNWSTEKTTGHWQEQGDKFHEKILVLESGDTIVRVGIKGDAISMY